MKIYDSILNINEMTRSGEKRKFTTKIVICDTMCKSIFEVMKKIKKKENENENYLSYNYVIESSGKIFRLVPDDEVSYFSNSIDLNLESISIGICFGNKEAIKKESKNENEKKWKESLIYLLNKLCEKYSKYNLSKENICIEYDIENTRNFGIVIDNYYILKKITESVYEK